jgi:hypothetical protein
MIVPDLVKAVEQGKRKHKMNERIQELADEANELDYETFDQYNHKTVKHYKFDKEKFAQLIVRECARVADVADENKCEWIGGNILTHFGVEE